MSPVKNFCAVLVLILASLAICEFTSDESVLKATGLKVSTAVLKKVSTASATAKNRRLLCSREQLIDGYWRPKTLEQAPYLSTYNEATCGPYEGAYYNITEESSTIPSYDWLPHDETCEFSPWTREEFCQIAHNKTIFMIGDSLSMEHHRSLGGLLGIGDTKYFVQDRQACNGTVRLIFRRNDNVNKGWVRKIIKETDPDYVVINRGAHYVEDDELMSGIPKLIGVVRNWQTRCKNESKACQLIWRTSVPGHPGCRNRQEPVNDFAKMEQLVANNKKSKKFFWDKFQHQNELIIQALKESGVNFSLLDAYHINILRPDGHVLGAKTDCLHSCLGSKIDVYSQILMHLIKVHDAKNDSQ
jgi:hypothetical protein